MYINDLYSKTLIEPCLNLDCNELYIISGYASATFVRKHIEKLLSINTKASIKLIIGMPGRKSDHIAFLDLHNEFSPRFEGYYYDGYPWVHCKTYAWFNNNHPIVGFTGSANYSQYGFDDLWQVNQMTQDDPILIRTLFDNLVLKSIYIPRHKIVIPKGTPVLNTLIGSVAPGRIHWEVPDKRVRISFLDKKGNLPATSGLNWGQRQEKRINKLTGIQTYVRREPNQAYLSLKLDSRKDGFLPARAFTFSLITDDGFSFDCAVAQDGRKAIHTNKDNSQLGLYIRKRLGLRSGAFVTKQDLINYGRTDYTIEKINEETFLFDFSKLT